MVNESIRVPRPDFAVRVGNGDVTLSVEPYVLGIDYVDNLTGKADEIQITLENSMGYFTGDYWPSKGDDLAVSIGYDSGELKGLWTCGGGFVTDEVEAHGPPDVVVIKALSTSVKQELRTPRSRGYENVNLYELGIKLGATMDTGTRGIRFKRVTQNNESDLTFLNRLAQQYGYICKVRDGNIGITSLGTLMGGEAQVTIQRGDILRYQIQAKTAHTKRAAVTRYWDPSKKGLIRGLVDPPALAGTMSPIVPNAKQKFTPRVILEGMEATAVTVGKIFDRVEDAAQSNARARGEMLKSQLGVIHGSMTITGDPRIRAGMMVKFSGLGNALTGSFIVKRAGHKLSRDGYTTEIDL